MDAWIESKSVNRDYVWFFWVWIESEVEELFASVISNR